MTCVIIILKMSLCGVRTHYIYLYMSYYFINIKEDIISNISYESNSICPLNVHQISFFLQTMVSNFNVTSEMVL